MDQLAWAPWYVAFVDWAGLAIHELALVNRACLGVCVVPRILLVDRTRGAVSELFGNLLDSGVDGACLGVCVVSRIVLVDWTRGAVSELFRNLLDSGVDGTGLAVDDDFGVHRSGEDIDWACLAIDEILRDLLLRVRIHGACLTVSIVFRILLARCYRVRT